MDGVQIRALINGYINSSNDAKQRLGRCFAVELGLEAGPRGSDGGVDGSGFTTDGRKIYFQSRLRSKVLGKADAVDFFENILKQKADIGIMLSGIGYTKNFARYKSDYPELQNAKIHLLSLQDIFENNLKYLTIFEDLSVMVDLNKIFN